MKQNMKQRLYAQSKVEAYDRKMKRSMFLSILILFMAVGIGAFASGDITTDDFSNVTTATIMGGVGNVVGRNNNKQAAGKKIKYRVHLLSEDQADVDNIPSRNGIEMGNIPLKAGEYWHTADAIDGTPQANFTGEMGDNAGTIQKELTFTAGGMSDNLLKLLEDGYGNYFFVVFELCETGEKWLAGDGCKPMRLTGFEGGFTTDYSGSTLTFTNENNITYSKYVGSVTKQAPDTVAADATEITLSDNSEYQLTDNTVATEITGFTQGGITDSDINRVLVIHGSGGSEPATITSSGNFLLQGGTTWTGTAGAQLTVKIVKFGATYEFMEVYGTRID